ncbi:Fpg/Nei family DNA glycosylase [Intrasporangium sp.]|uniref:Fpg/Nei family DNA glycosylase n=1 Tax=Intrasporangium sp. TaxID=1925024 RepID=UPI00293A97B9|nr:DNA-formamidopyrimidine glycosylase family protein [Intrasporangium sp.]MDV3219968.1 Fpg/Nei family DNA glycosylase [Intrasporangium sp.]
MPEGHTIHALAARLNRTLGRRPVAVSSPQGRFAADAALIDGRILEAASARGKHLFVDFDDIVLHVHLGLIGSFHVKPRADEARATSPARLRIEGADHVAELRGPMICALVDDATRRMTLEKLGPDPLHPPDRAGDGAGRAWERITKSRKAIAELLLDQSVVAGVGNVYRCEVLFRHRIDPFTPGRDLGRRLWDEVWDDLVTLLPLGMAFSQILTMQDQVDAAAEMVADGSSLAVTERLTGERLGDHFERRFHTYQRTGEACDRCGRRVREQVIGGRTLYWCPGCQRRRKR